MPNISALALTGMRLVLCLLMAMPFLTRAEQPGAADDLLGQIESLQSQMNIQIVGLEKIDNGEKIRATGNPDRQLQQILVPYNHVVSRTPQGRIEKVVVIGRKQKTDTDRIVLPSRYEDGHFLVSLAVSGTGRFWENLEMIVDTGADLMVLPASMIDKLGISGETFAIRKMQTANGAVDARIGTLREVRIAGEILENVAAAFIDDNLLANKNLLGMSALGRYKLVIDTPSQAVMLLKK